MINLQSNSWVVIFKDPPICKPSILTAKEGFVYLDKLTDEQEIKRFMTKGHALSYAENMYGDITLFDYMQEKELKNYGNKI